MNDYSYADLLHMEQPQRPQRRPEPTPQKERGGVAGGEGSSPASGSDAPVGTHRIEATPTALDTVQQDTAYERAGTEQVSTPPASEQQVSALEQAPVPEPKKRKRRSATRQDRKGDLPRKVSFECTSQSSNPLVRSLPEELQNTLRARLVNAVVSELPAGMSDEGKNARRQEAQDFAGKLSQTALVMGYLCSQLDPEGHIGFDEATEKAAALFRVSDPIMGSVTGQIDELVTESREQVGRLGAVNSRLKDVESSLLSLEQGMAYMIADTTVNFLRGNHNLDDAPFWHDTVVEVRDRVRQAAARQERKEREREGRLQ